MTAVHSPAPEELMAYLDGELPAAASQEMQTHLAGCETCRQVAEDLGLVSNEMRSWQVEEPPDSVRPPAASVVESAQRAGRLGSPRRQVRAFVRSRAWRALRARPVAVSAAAAVVFVAAFAVVFQPARKASIQQPSLDRIVREHEPLGTSASDTRLGGTAAPARGAGGFTEPSEPLREMPDAAGAMQTPSAAARGPQIERTVSLRISTPQFDTIRPAVERILQRVGGFAGRIDASDPGEAARSMRATLRIPNARVDEAVAELRKLGRVTEESQNAEDMAEQIVDLDVRLANARITEKRLNDLVQNRTGRVSEVLETEREIARVRTEIERLDAQRQSLERRVTLATVILEVLEERRAAVNLGAVPVPTRLRLAVADGIETAAASVVGAALVLLRAGPALLVWATLLGVPGWLVLRRAKRPRSAVR